MIVSPVACEWCGSEFHPPARRGPTPKYCSAAHRQAAHRSRQATAGTQTGVEGARVDPSALVLRHRRRIVEIAAERNATNVRVFGSVARGVSTDQGDVDFLVDLDPDVGLVGLVGLERELSALLGRDVDVVPAGQLKPELREAAEAESISL